MKSLYNNIIAKILPVKGSFDAEIKTVVETINKELKKNKVKATAVVGGSFAKDTHLIGDHDCDIFVRFDYSYKEKNISDLLEKALKQYKPARVHGSRDYFQFTKSLNYEIVPVLSITKPEQALNVTDASPLHVAWVKKFKKSNEIRLAKAFCKAQGIYGAESYIKGFSGHVLDILTIYYGSFEKLLRASQKWKGKTVIDIQKYHKDALFALNTSKTISPLIVVDPIQKDRNASAALSQEKLDIFVQKAKEFLKKPSEKFFERKALSKKDIKGAIILDFVPLKGKRDVVGAKAMKALETMNRELEDNGFTIKDSGWTWDGEEFFWIKLKEEKLSATETIRGPPVAIEKHAAAFKKAHKQVTEKKGVLYATAQRKYTDARKLLADVIKTPDVKDRVKSITLSS